MTITAFHYGDMLDKENFRRKDHILFDLPVRHTGLKVYDLSEVPGFNFYKQLINHGVPLDEYGGNEPGEVWTYSDEENYVTYHGLVCFSVTSELGWTGYHPDHYAMSVPALTKVYEEQDALGEWVRPARSTMCGHGTYHATGEGLFARGYQFPWNQDVGLAVLSNTDMELEVWSVDVPDIIEEQHA